MIGENPGAGKAKDGPGRQPAPEFALGVKKNAENVDLFERKDWGLTIDWQGSR
ncbi:MAG: hypothetical protein LBU79_00475 [Planctomycetota bacterium]|jgi:hypothetical protein|nr:hypothetical protein [Planctomycetota bacterium]